MFKKFLFFSYFCTTFLAFAAPKVEGRLQRWLGDSSIKDDTIVEIAINVAGKSVADVLRKTADFYDWMTQNHKDINLYQDSLSSHVTLRTSKESLVQLIKEFPDCVTEVASAESLGFIETTTSELSDIRNQAANTILYEAKTEADIVRSTIKAQEFYQKALVIIQKDFDLKFELDENAQKVLAAAVISPQSLAQNIPIEIMVSLARTGTAGAGYNLNNDHKYHKKNGDITEEGDAPELPAVDESGKVLKDQVWIYLRAWPTSGGASYTYREVPLLATAWDYLATMLIDVDAAGKVHTRMPGKGRYSFERVEYSPDYHPSWNLVDHQKPAK